MTGGRDVVVGIDIARRSDYAATVHLVADGGGRWHVARAEQIPHAATYADLESYTAHLAGRGYTVAVDATGCGVPVLEHVRALTDAPVWGVNIHGGQKARQVGRYDLSLPKSGLISYGRHRLDAGTVTIPDCPGADLLVSQLAQIAPVRRRGRRPALEARHGHDDVAFGFLVGLWLTR